MTTIVVEVDLEFESCVPAEKFFKAICDFDNLPKVAPHLIQSVEIIEETIKKINFTPGHNKECTYVMLVVVTVEEEKLYLNFIIMEVDKQKYMKIEVEISFEVTPCGGSIFKAHIVFNSRTFNEEAIEKAKNIFEELFKAFEAHLLADADV